jgi:hypothetical protein
VRDTFEAHEIDPTTSAFEALEGATARA